MEILDRLSEAQEKTIEELVTTMLMTPEAATKYEASIGDVSMDFYLPEQDLIERALIDSGRDERGLFDSLAREVRLKKYVLAEALVRFENVKFETDEFNMKRKLLGRLPSEMVEYLWSKYTAKRAELSIILHGENSKVIDIVKKSDASPSGDSSGKSSEPKAESHQTEGRSQE